MPSTSRLLNSLRPRRPLKPLPATFMFGVGNSDHQVEAYDSRFEDIRDVWDRRLGYLPRGKATDFWNRYPEDIQLARDLGCKMFRFSASWASIETAPGVFNPEALKHYREVAQAIRDAGMEPMLTLHHFAWPLHIEANGGMLADDFSALFSRFTAQVVEALGDLVQYWITFNEPTILILGYIKPWWQRDFFFPPGLPLEATIDDQLEAVSKVMRNLFLAHTAARSVIKQKYPNAKVGSNPAILGLPTWLQGWINRNATQIRNTEDWIRQGQRYADRAVLARGVVDMVAATLTVTEQRATQVDFSEVYYVAGQTLLVKDSSPLQTAEDVAQKKVAVVKSSTAENAVRQLLPEAAVQSVQDYTEALKALDFAQVDAILADNTILLGIMKEKPNLYRLVGGLLTSEPYAIAISSGNPELLNQIDLAVRAFKGTPWAESFARNFPGEPVPQPPELGTRTPLQELQTAELAVETDKSHLDLARPGTLLRRIQERGYLKVAVKKDVPGFGYLDPNTGEWSGLEIDLARAVAQQIFGSPDKVEFSPATTQQRIPLLRSILSVFDPLLKRYAILTSAFLSDWWHLGMAGKLSSILCPAECIDQQDFIGFDYYWGISSLQITRIQRLAESLSFGQFDNAPVWSGALYEIIKFHAALFPGKEIIVVENGCVDQADGITRPEYLEMHTWEVRRACDEGMKVTGYICWSITTNREWGAKILGAGNDFGLYHIDLDGDPALKRIPTSAVEAYRTIIKQNLSQNE